MNNDSLKRNKEVILLFVIAFAARLLAWPWAQNTEADAASRILLSEDLEQNFRLIYSGHWPSLHFYFTAFFIWLFNDRVIGPTFMSILLGAVSIIPFYLFTRDVFNRKGAVYASLIFTFSGVIFRHSFHALAEIYHVCFSLWTIYFISQVSRHPDKKMRFAVLAGIMGTIATGGRFEAWIIVALLGVVLLLQKEWKAFFVYCVFVSPFPVFWLIGNYMEFHDPIYSLHSVEHFNFDIGGVNDSVDPTEKLRRIIFFPVSWAIAISPVTAAILIGIIVRRSTKKMFTREQVYYLCIGLFFFITFIVKCYNGSLVIAHRFTVSLVFLTVPFFALWFENQQRTRLKSAVTIVIITGIIPFSFYWQYIPVSRAFAFNERAENAFDEIIYSTYQETQAVPRLMVAEADTIVRNINARLVPGDGCLVDFADWESAYYMGLELRVGVWDEFIISGGAHYAIPYDRMGIFLNDHPRGKLVLSDWSPFDNGTHLHGNILDHDSLPGSFVLTPISVNGHLRAFEYVYVLGDERDQLRTAAAAQPPIYGKKKDLAYYSGMIVGTADWYMQIVRQAHDNHRSIDEMVRENAQWMIDHSVPEMKNDSTHTQ